MMKTVFVGVILVIFTLTGVVFAFHEGGPGYCDGCHTIHLSSGSGNQITSRLMNNATGPLIRGSDPSSTCLRCHAEPGRYYAVLSNNGSMFSPGGDFYWLRKTFTWSKGVMTYRSEGDNHGHNVEAIDYALTTDRAQNPDTGDVYPAEELDCTSCHDPHARSSATGNYRLLGDVGYERSGLGGGFSFINPTPIAVADEYDWTESDNNHTAYGSGMSEWCANCHPGFLDDINKHPAGNNAKLGEEMIFNYNSYVKTGDIYGSSSTAYLALVPFELGITDTALLDPWSTSGPDYSGKANVMCLTCHRAHASAFDNIGRWDFKATLLADSHPQYSDGGVSGDDVMNSYYGRDIIAEFGKYQRQLCNKCHVQD
jgi:hypothetical protein